LLENPDAVFIFPIVKDRLENIGIAPRRECLEEAASYHFAAVGYSGRCQNRRSSCHHVGLIKENPASGGVLVENCRQQRAISPADVDYCPESFEAKSSQNCDGYLAGKVDTVIMRLLDVLIAFPSLVLTLAVAQALGASMVNTIFALAFFSIPAFARVSRSAVLRLRDMPFMAAAKLAGTPGHRMLFKHLAPNIAPQLITFGMLGMGIVIIIEGALSFLGLGIPDPAPSWGNMVATGQLSLSATPMLVVWPSLALLVTVLAFNLLGENLRARWSGR